MNGKIIGLEDIGPGKAIIIVEVGSNMVTLMVDNSRIIDMNDKFSGNKIHAPNVVAKAKSTLINKHISFAIQ
ncbi:MAG: hypothetical protein WC916_04125 [Candidatus Woesearchaeota archaeon]